MKREQKYGVALTVVGVLSLPVFIGIPLLATGILLLVKGERIHAERWIRVLFWIMLAALALAIVFLLIFSVDGAGSAESGIARSILCFAPTFLAIMASLVMAGLTLARFPSLSRKHRLMGLGFGVLCVVGAGIALAFAFPWQTLGLGGLVCVGWLGVWYWKRKQARRAAAPEKPVIAAALPILHPASVAPATPVVRPPRRRPVFNLLALGLPVLAVPVGLLLAWLASHGHYEGFQAWAIVGWAFIPMMIAIPVSLIFAVVSLCRRERFLILTIIELILHGLILVGIASSFFA